MEIIPPRNKMAHPWGELFFFFSSKGAYIVSAYPFSVSSEMPFRYYPIVICFTKKNESQDKIYGFP